jgi:hypothetical protein
MVKEMRFLCMALTYSVLIITNAYAHEKSHYPTATLADYVFACMAANGQRYDILQKCSCSIDYIAERMPHEDYETIEAIMQAQQDIGQRGIFYREAQWAHDKVDKLKKIQAESTIACF